MSEIPQSRDLEAAIIADRLAAVATALWAVYVISVLALSFPPRWLDPVWQLSSIKIAVEAAPMPLLGLALVHLAAYLCPANTQLQRRRQALARLAILPVFGFLLIIPVQGHAIWKSYRVTNSFANQLQGNASQRADEVRLAIERATSAADLQKRLLAPQRRELQIRLDTERIATIPLPQLKQQLLAQLNQAEGQFKARYGALDPVATERITRESLRLTVSSLAFAIGFAACAQRKNSRVPFLVELPSLPSRLIASLMSRRSRPSQGSGGLHFMKSASKREEEFFESLAPPEDDTPKNG